MARIEQISVFPGVLEHAGEPVHSSAKTRWCHVETEPGKIVRLVEHSTPSNRYIIRVVYMGEQKMFKLLMFSDYICIGVYETLSEALSQV